MIDAVTDPTDPRTRRGPQSPQEWIRIRNAACHARRLFPGAIGELLARELVSYAELGWLLPDSLSERVIDEVLGGSHTVEPHETRRSP